MHRDIKPANIWLDAGTDRARILDFGLARAADGADRLSESGEAVGTPAYMAPEQLDGQDVDARADLFSLGTTLYLCATGQKPFVGLNHWAVICAVKSYHPRPPQELDAAIPPALSDLIVRLVCKEPSGRPLSAQAVADELAALSEPTLPIGPNHPPRLAPSKRRIRRSLLLAVAAAAVVLVAVGAWVLTHLPKPEGEVAATDATAHGGQTAALPEDRPSEDRPLVGSFANSLGDVRINDVKPAAVYDLPYLTWGGDVATLIANGESGATQKGTLFDQQNVRVNLVNGDDFLGQVKNYLDGKTPFLRGTLSQLGQTSEVLGQDPRTKPIVFLQLSWSQGDYMVVRPTIKTLNDLKGKKIVLQENGPHVDMLSNALHSAGLKWSDITVVWTNDITPTAYGQPAALRSGFATTRASMLASSSPPTWWN